MNNEVTSVMSTGVYFWGAVGKELSAAFKDVSGGVTPAYEEDTFWVVLGMRDGDGVVFNDVALTYFTHDTLEGLWYEALLKR